MNVEAYLKAADRGDFHWEGVEYNDYSIQVEECTYKEKYVNAKITKISNNEYEVEVDNLLNEPKYILQVRSSRKSARVLVERIVRNDREGDWQKNLKYAD